MIMITDVDVTTTSANNESVKQNASDIHEVDLQNDEDAFLDAHKILSRLTESF